MKKALAVSILLVMAYAGTAYAGMKWDAYTGIKARNRPTMLDVLKHAGEPDFTREFGHGNRVHLYYSGGEGGRDAELPTTIIIDGRTDRVIKIIRDR